MHSLDSAFSHSSVTLQRLNSKSLNPCVSQFYFLNFTFAFLQPQGELKLAYGNCSVKLVAGPGVRQGLDRDEPCKCWVDPMFMLNVYD